MKFLFQYLFILFSFCALGQTNPSLPDKVVKSINERIDGGLNPGIVIGIMNRDGKNFYTFGRNSGKSEIPDRHSVYEIGSITKVFTCIMLAKLAEEGKINMGDPIGMYLPDSVEAPTRNGMDITLEDLATHLSGLPRLPDNMDPADPLNPYADYTVDQLYAFLSGHKLVRDIGSEYEYSNLAMGLLGHILATHTGTTYEDLLIEMICKPLDMTHTRITLTTEMEENLCPGHYAGMEVKNWDIPALAGAGAVRSCLSDMSHFIGANLGLIGSPLFAAMKESHKTRHNKGPDMMRVGLGWHIMNGIDGDIIWHNGGTGGYRSFAGFVVEKQTGVVVLTNSTESIDDIGFYLLDTSKDLRRVVPYISTVLREAIENDGLDAAVRLFHELRKDKSNLYDFGEHIINSLGNAYLFDDKIEAALAVFKLNTEAYPNSSDVYDSYAEALMKDDRKDLAIENYKRSLEINPGNKNALEKLAELGVQMEMADIILSEEWLEKLTGTYNLFPNFDIVITREGQKLFGQATGQGQFELFAKSETEFYLKIVSAQITFSVDDSGGVQSLTLFQNGMEMEGTKKD